MAKNLLVEYSEKLACEIAVLCKSYQIDSNTVQNAHGFVINNCVVTSVLREYETEELYQYAFKFVTNAALEKGALPVDDTQTPNTPNENKSGIFNSTELGYQTITNVCILK